ncbi:hypothetical protein, partial [Modestobacter roseus]|uniref:hypothetical protein n=1 Tax=Modestobacter roseus TaxID=1181884 RepID=UPI0034DE2731
VVLLVAGAALTGTGAGEPPAAARPSRAPAVRPYVAPPPMLYDLPVRGSLADDEDFVAAVAALDWTPEIGLDGLTYGGAGTVEDGTQRVVFAGDVPGGRRWAVVLAQAGREWAWAWFTGPAGARPAQLTPVVTGMTISGQERLALVDVSSTTGPLVVLAEPEVAAEYSPSLDRAPDGALVRDFDPLPMDHGVPTGMVTTPIIWNAGEVRLDGGAGDGMPLHPMTAGQHPTWPAGPTGPVDDALVAPCLEQLGFTVAVQMGGLSWSEDDRPEMSTDEEAAREHEIAACFRGGQG